MFDHLAVVWLIKKLTDRLCDNRPDIVDGQQLLDRCIHHAVNAAEIFRQLLGGRLTNVTNPERKQKSGERRGLRLTDTIEQVLRRLFGHARQIRQRHQTEPIQVGGRVHQIVFDELINQLVPEALDVHGAALRKVQQRLFALCRTVQPASTTSNRLPLQSHNGGIALRAARRHDKPDRVNGAIGEHHRRDLRDDIARTPDHNGVANLEVLAPQFVLVMQGRIRYRGAADKHRLQSCNGCDRAGAPDLHVDAKQHGGGFLGGKLVGNGKTWRARDESELFLQPQIVDFVDNAIDVEGQARSRFTNAAIVFEQAGNTPDNAARFGHWKMQAAEHIYHLTMGGGQQNVLGCADAIGEKR